ncbi:MAG: hypothetical protein ACYCW6_18530 [Candidatus Xenobia bacterium]
MGGIVNALTGSLGSVGSSLGLAPANGSGGFTYDAFDATTGANQLVANDQVNQDLQAIANKTAELDNNPGMLTHGDQSSVSSGGQSIAAAGQPQDADAQRQRILAPLMDALATDVEARQTGTTDV